MLLALIYVMAEDYSQTCALDNFNMKYFYYLVIIIIINIIIKYLGFLLTNKNFIQEEIKRRVKAENSCYCSVQTFLSSRLLSKNLKIKVYKTIIFPVVLYGRETGSFTLREEHRLGVFENRILRRIILAKAR